MLKNLPNFELIGLLNYTFAFLLPLFIQLTKTNEKNKNVLNWPWYVLKSLINLRLNVLLKKVLNKKKVCV